MADIPFENVNLCYMFGFINRDIDEKPEWCRDPPIPPCAAYAQNSYLVSKT